MLLEQDGCFGKLKQNLASAGNRGCKSSQLLQTFTFCLLPYQRIRLVLLRVRVKFFELFFRKELIPSG